MQKLVFYAFAINVLLGLVAAFVWLPDLIGASGYFIAIIYAGFVILGANSFSDARRT